MYINWDPIYKFILWKGFSIHIYSLMFVLSFGIGWHIMKYIYRIENIHQKYLDSLLIYTILGTLIGARLGQVFFYDISYFSDHWLEALFPIKENTSNYLLGIIRGYEFIGYRGLSSHGATIGIVLSIFFYRKKILNKSFFWICDRLCIVSTLAAVFIRIGNFFNSEIVGKPCNPLLPWSVKFVQMDTEYGDLVPRHPTQIYESIIYLFIFLFLWFLYRKSKVKEIIGYISGMFFTLLWSARFLLEFMKEPQGDEILNVLYLNTGQLLSIPCIIFGIFVLYFSKKKTCFFS
ncbi:prolipoprotein diacylglyceryl transferase [Blattabacterium sp. (Mastotermes darwiniensis) str. MADAR]|uniref:prolipoprotein diacylglyceryl transferase n=1 Tax=Blattabacterium sp. (Mastotermes darwiniensis) TaxID=39768 RepID=UPI000231DF2C|nr:prolipoprotein diacylglyceryl transferase [Blattabacterium sp. (Mastotermes darwiniensis)]AER40864.1 prolipoprotein diacylglyceryl transferase [Blattabacterium sp. (Mastotermes darwiniensis) str. MADAR]